MKKISNFGKDFKKYVLEDELWAATELNNAFEQIGAVYSKVTDETIKLYQQSHPDATFRFDISISTLRNYLQGYSIRQTSPYLVKELTISELKMLYEKIGCIPVSEPPIPTTSNYKNEYLNIGQKIALEYAEKSETYKNFEALNMRCASPIKKSFLELCANHPCFGKSFLFTFVIEKGIEKINE
ncbi:MAG: hypothetical protein PHN38_09865 [Sulfurospirillaceae bacterium]|nr:hypothetical protein [Sulfurospirillaceae bacterium]